MPSNKSRRVASRQAQAREQARRKARRGPGPVITQPPVSTEMAPSGDASAEEPESLALAEPTPARPPTPSPAVRSSLRRERPSVTILSTASLRGELTRIGVIISVIAGILAGIKFGTDVGA